MAFKRSPVRIRLAPPEFPRHQALHPTQKRRPKRKFIRHSSDQRPGGDIQNPLKNFWSQQKFTEILLTSQEKRYTLSFIRYFEKNY